MVDERQWTASLAELFGSRQRGIRVGIGDDAAVVRHRGGDLVVTCDPVIEGVHFDPDAPPTLVGRKAVNRNLSDLAAMGAAADWLVLSAVLPPALSGRRRRSLFEGVRDAAAAADCAVVGGDVAVASGPLVLTVTALGHLQQPALRRDGARPGDALHTTGPLGGSSLGHHLRFRPQLAEGAWLARQPNVSAAIDVSDGLLLDLATVLRASGGLGAVVWADRVPIARAARRLARQSGQPPLQHALGDGEDHVLLFAVRGGRPLRRGGPLEPAARRPFGRVTAEPGLHLVESDGTAREVDPAGYQHQL